MEEVAIGWLGVLSYSRKNWLVRNIVTVPRRLRWSSSDQMPADGPPLLRGLVHTLLMAGKAMCQKCVSRCGFVRLIAVFTQVASECVIPAPNSASRYHEPLINGGRYWTRTNDPLRVKQVL